MCTQVVSMGDAKCRVLSEDSDTGSRVKVEVTNVEYSVTWRIMTYMEVTSLARVNCLGRIGLL